MPKTVSVSKAKNELSAMLEWAVENQDEVVVESHGRPKAAILPYASYESFLALREKEQRQAAVQRMQAIAAVVQARNRDLKPEEADQIAEEIMREAVSRIADEG